MNNEEQHTNNLTQTAPERIWLHPAKQGGILFTEDEAFPESGSYEHGRTYWNDSCDHSGSVPYIRADLAQDKATQWKPIAEMPEDWENVLLYTGCRSEYVVACYDPTEKCWMSDYNGKGHEQFIRHATHWMPLPTAPQAEAEEGK